VTDDDPLNIRIGTLNVCGIRRRLQYPDFEDMINTYDLFCCTETKLDTHDFITIDNYTFFSQCRKQKVFRRSGGVGFFI